MKLSGKTAVVTGAGTGIGKGTAIALAQQGANVAIAYHASAAGAEDTHRKIAQLGGESIKVQADVANKAEIDRMIKQVADHYGCIDILVNNAALQLNYDLFEHDEDSYDRMMNINLKGYWQCIQAVIPHMKAQGSGRIINIASVHSKRPTDFDTVYSMTKGGIKMLGREAAIELAKYGITVNTIEPGAIDVGKQKRKAAAQQPAAPKPSRDIRKKFPLGRIGLPSDVGSLVCYLASDESEFLTGAGIRLDGGSMLL